MLKTTKLAPSFEMDKLIEATAGFSGSDLKEICRNAAMIPVREYVRSVEPKDHDGDASNDLLGIDMEVSDATV
jgi:ATP-dependent 26S proteasome regulatory subunit